VAGKKRKTNVVEDSDDDNGNVDLGLQSYSETY
jgi:hypothetical protein